MKCTVILADIADWEAMNSAYRAFFPTDKPARMTFDAAQGADRTAADAGNHRRRSVFALSELFAIEAEDEKRSRETELEREETR